MNNLNNTLEYILPDNVKVNVTFDDIRLKSILKINQTSIFTNKSFLMKGFTRSRSYHLDNIDGIYQLIGGSFKSEKPIINTGIDKILLKCDCFNGSTVDGNREAILYSFALSFPPGHKIFEEPREFFLKTINKSVLSHITFYLEDDDHKPVEFHNETISSTCQINKFIFRIIIIFGYVQLYELKRT